ncbi:MAG: response regulator [Planctomycetales bacterium]|nr:response regulator [Planctomycetales bacterium]
MATLLQLAGHYVQTAYDGAAAVAVAKQQRPNVVLLDLAMPKLSGYKVIENLQGQPETADALFIAVTGYGQSTDRIRTSESGFHLHLVKPVDARQLVAYLNGEPNQLVQNERWGDDGTI